MYVYESFPCFVAGALSGCGAGWMGWVEDIGVRWMSDCVVAACERCLALSFGCCAPRLMAEKAGPQGMYVTVKRLKRVTTDY